MSEFKNIKFFDGNNEVSLDQASTDRYFKNSYDMAKLAYHNVIDEINDYRALLILNNSVKDDLFHLDRVSPELEKIISERTNHK